jgi:hypothetical protein
MLTTDKSTVYKEVINRFINRRSFFEKNEKKCKKCENKKNKYHLLFKKTCSHLKNRSLNLKSLSNLLNSPEISHKNTFRKKLKIVYSMKNFLKEEIVNYTGEFQHTGVYSGKIKGFKAATGPNLNKSARLRRAHYLVSVRNSKQVN